MLPTFSTLSIELEGNYSLKVFLNRPEVCNAINFLMMQELTTLWQWVASQSQLRCVVLSGMGEKYFCAGADLKQRRNLTEKEWKQQHQQLQQAMTAMSNCPVPIIAAVNGVAFGGGLELALASDFAYAADTAFFSQSEVKLGIMPGAMGTQNLPLKVGLSRAKELTFTGSRFTAVEALEWGVVNAICPAAELYDRVGAQVDIIVQNAPLAIRQSKKALNHAVAKDIIAGYDFEISCYNELLSTQDRVEGIEAFNDKRIAKFEGK
jgi:enoyl-CoA hydratase